MNAYHKRQKQKKRNGIFRKWHRRLGFAASLLLLNLAVTGILLNHYESLELHKSYVTSDWLLNLYGISAPASAECFQTKSLRACQMDRFIYLNGNYWQEVEGHLSGVTNVADGFEILTDQHIFILTQTLALIDKISIEESLPTNIQSLTTVNDRIFANTDNGYYEFDSNELNWSHMMTDQNLEFESNNNVLLSSIDLTLLQNDYRRHQITHLKLLEDLHSGRILFLSGRIANDIAAIILILLGLSGVITWQRRLHSK